MRGDRASDDNDDKRAAAMTTVTWPWVTGFGLLGFGFGLCIRDFFLFFINTSVFSLLEHLCVWFAGVCFAFLLGFDLSANDDTTWWVSFLYQRRDEFHFWFSVFFLVENLWACRERATYNILGSPWAWLFYYFFFLFQILVQIFFGFFFFFFFFLGLKVEQITDNFFFF